MADDDLEVRIAAALVFARTEEDRLSTASAVAETTMRRFALRVQGAAYNAVRTGLEEIIDPGCHSDDEAPRSGEGAPPFAPRLADAPKHPDEPS